MFGVLIALLFSAGWRVLTRSISCSPYFYVRNGQPQRTFKSRRHIHLRQKKSSAPTTSKKVQAELTLPTSLGQIAKDNETRISFIMYRTTSLFRSRSLNKANKDQVKFKTIPNTRIISATTYGVDATNLSEPVNTTYVAAQTEDNKVHLFLNLSFCL